MPDALFVIGFSERHAYVKSGDFHAGTRAYPFGEWLSASRQVAERAIDHFYSPSQRDSYAVRYATWQEREGARFCEDGYQPVPWAAEPWWTEAVHDSRHAASQHFAHISLDDPTKLAFTEDAAKGEADRQTRIKPGRYLSRFFGEVLTPKQIAFYAEWFAKGERPESDLLEGRRFELAKSPQAIADVYQSGPRSCMDGENFDDADDNPTRIYGAGDLAVAYIANPGTAQTARNPEVMARALVWPERKVYGRIYPTVDSHWSDEGYASQDDCQAVYDTLESQLREAGYKSLDEDDRGFNGARLILEWSHNHRQVVMPYLDRNYRATIDGEGVLRLQRGGEIEGDNTCGWSDAEDSDRATCEHCDARVEDYDTTTVWSRGVGGDPETWCDNCADRAAFWCDGGERYVATNYGHNHRVTVITDVHGGTETWSDDYAGSNGFECAHTGQHAHDALHAWVIVDADGAGEDWALTREAEAETFLCGYDGARYARALESTRFPGFPAALDDDPVIDEATRRVNAPPCPATAPLALEAA